MPYLVARVTLGFCRELGLAALVSRGLTDSGDSSVSFAPSAADIHRNRVIGLSCSRTGYYFKDAQRQHRRGRDLGLQCNHAAAPNTVPDSQ